MTVFDGVAGVSVGDVLLTLWRTPAREARVRRVTDWTVALLALEPGTFAACQLLLPSARPPDRAARAATREGYAVVGPRARRLVTVPLGGSLWQRLVRTLIRTGVALTGQAARIKVAGTTATAFALLEAVATPRSPSRAQLEAAAAALFDALGEAPP